MVLTLFHIDNFRNLPSNYLDKMITNLRFVRVKPIINSQRFIQIKKADEIKIDNQIQQTIKKSLLAQQDWILKTVHDSYLRLFYYLLSI